MYKFSTKQYPLVSSCFCKVKVIAEILGCIYYLYVVFIEHLFFILAFNHTSIIVKPGCYFVRPQPAIRIQ